MPYSCLLLHLEYLHLSLLLHSSYILTSISMTGISTMFFPKLVHIHPCFLGFGKICTFSPVSIYLLLPPQLGPIAGICVPVLTAVILYPRPLQQEYIYPWQCCLDIFILGPTQGYSFLALGIHSSLAQLVLAPQFGYIHPMPHS
jgi:hypothetical protein